MDIIEYIIPEIQTKFLTTAKEWDFLSDIETLYIDNK